MSPDKEITAKFPSGSILKAPMKVFIGAIRVIPIPGVRLGEQRKIFNASRGGTYNVNPSFADRITEALIQYGYYPASGSLDIYDEPEEENSGNEVQISNKQITAKLPSGQYITAPSKIFSAGVNAAKHIPLIPKRLNEAKKILNAGRGEVYHVSKIFADSVTRTLIANGYNPGPKPSDVSERSKTVEELFPNRTSTSGGNNQSSGSSNNGTNLPTQPAKKAGLNKWFALLLAGVGVYTVIQINKKKK